MVMRFMLRWSSCGSYGREWEVFEDREEAIEPLRDRHGTHVDVGGDKGKGDVTTMETESCSMRATTLFLRMLGAS